MEKEIICKYNGEKIYGIINVPDYFEGKIPIVILCHGFSDNYNAMRDFCDLLEEKSIASYLFDFRGGGFDCHSDMEMKDMSILTE